ncbi:DUF2835 domain-containing protein [Methylomonas sp. EFPC3]|uniref:DUF2835 domain-containing protein n=1 Tax=Methylomonas TaxID=416 RepID=UPI001127E4B4|nr:MULTISPECIES: DUF2835 domain-containing protein [Methylomonas]TPQ27966.1 DUF2835 domain-containing protein [Methylomonas koyamae]WFP50198.1 DUF2835 domain-containing protein [Methylomonas sp. EFPC3]
MVNQFIRFRLDLSYDRFLAVYQGHAKTISVLADDGRRIQFPAGNIQRYLTKNGIQGYFEMELGPANKFVALRRLD